MKFTTGQKVHVVGVDEDFIPCVKTGEVRMKAGNSPTWWVAGIHGTPTGVSDIEETKMHVDMATALQACREVIETRIGQLTERLATIKAMQSIGNGQM